MTLILSLIYIAELVFFCYQDWRLGQTFRWQAWRWEIAGITIAVAGLFARMGVSRLMDIPPCDVAPDWFVQSGLVLGIVSIACLNRSRHLLHKSLEGMFKRTPKDSKPPQ